MRNLYGPVSCAQWNPLGALVYRFQVCQGSLALGDGQNVWINSYTPWTRARLRLAKNRRNPRGIPSKPVFNKLWILTWQVLQILIKGSFVEKLRVTDGLILTSPEIIKSSWHVPEEIIQSGWHAPQEIIRSSWHVPSEFIKSSWYVP